MPSACSRSLIESKHMWSFPVRIEGLERQILAPSFNNTAPFFAYGNEQKGNDTNQPAMVGAARMEIHHRVPYIWVHLP